MQTPYALTIFSESVRDRNNHIFELCVSKGKYPDRGESVRESEYEIGIAGKSEVTLKGEARARVTLETGVVSRVGVSIWRAYGGGQGVAL